MKTTRQIRAEVVDILKKASNPLTMRTIARKVGEPISRVSTQVRRLLEPMGHGGVVARKGGGRSSAYYWVTENELASLAQDEKQRKLDVKSAKEAAYAIDDYTRPGTRRIAKVHITPDGYVKVRGTEFLNWLRDQFRGI